MIAALAVLIIGFMAFLAYGFSSARNIPKSNKEQVFTKETSKAYDWMTRWPQFAFLRFLVVRKATKMKAGGLIVDVGCGNGLLLLRLSNAFPNAQLVGIDLSKAQLDKAKQNLKGKKIGFHQGDSQALPLADKSVDFLISTLSLHHWSDPVSAFGQIHRV